MSVPSFLQPYLWSYDISKIDKVKYRKMIITQVLHYGDNKAVKWVFSNYTRKEMEEALLHPSRGVWFRENLKKWLRFFNMTIDPLEFEVAIFDLTSRPKLMREFFLKKTDHFNPRDKKL